MARSVISMILVLGFVAACTPPKPTAFKAGGPQKGDAKTQEGDAKPADEAGADKDVVAEDAVKKPADTDTKDVLAGETESTPPGPPVEAPAIPVVKKPATEADALKLLPDGELQFKAMCARPGNDKIRQTFCVPTRPTIKSLVELQAAIGLKFVNPALVARNQNGTGGNPGFVVSGHSSSLVGRFTSAINPRAVIFTPPNGNNPVPNITVMGFVRGEQFAEVVSADATTNVLSFFLVKFEQACNATEKGCAVGELLTPAVEKDWTKVTIYEDTDLENTVFDCKQCHQPGGPTTPKMLRMQELQNPWTHFMRDNTPGGISLIADFHAAHGTTEDYAGIPAAVIGGSDPARLENLVRGQGFGTQPNEFPTKTIEGQVVTTSALQPQDNSVAGVSAAWQTAYNMYVTGQTIAPPYHDVKVTDKTKLATMTAAYSAFRAGTTPAKDLTDIRAVLADDHLREMGFGVKPGLDANGILVNACTQCHNSKLNQTISRAKFNVDLTKMSREEKDVAIERLKLPHADPKRMPPERFRDLSEAEIQSLVTLLKQ